MTNISYQSSQIFHIARKTVPAGELHGIFGRSVRCLQMWAANPRHCEETRRNPMDRMQLFIEALDDHGRGDVARAALEYMAGNTGFCISDETPAHSDKNSVDGEIADLTRHLDRKSVV